jgi:steroid delta-isomerase-like uncharacterized protein
MPKYRHRQLESMTENSLIDAATRTIDAYGNKDWDDLRQSISPHARYEELGTQRELEGADALVEAWQAWAKALPDSEATVESSFVSGNTVVLELTWRGHHNGPLETPEGTLRATGRPIELRACQVIGMERGKPASIRHYFDMATLLQQVGATGGKAESSRPKPGHATSRGVTARFR